MNSNCIGAQLIWLHNCDEIVKKLVICNGLMLTDRVCMCGADSTK